MGILIKPIITEKATLASEHHNRYTFLVNTKANKVEIKIPAKLSMKSLTCFGSFVFSMSDKIGTKA